MNNSTEQLYSVHQSVVSFKLAVRLYNSTVGCTLLCGVCLALEEQGTGPPQGFESLRFDATKPAESLIELYKCHLI